MVPGREIMTLDLLLVTTEILSSIKAPGTVVIFFSKKVFDPTFDLTLSRNDPVSGVV